jgi:hypothetical protein
MQLASDFAVGVQGREQLLWQLVVTFKDRQFNNNHLLLDVLGGIPLTDATVLHLFDEGMASSYTASTILTLMPQIDALTLPKTKLEGLYGISEPTDVIEIEPLAFCAHLKSIVVDIVCEMEEVDIDLLASWLRQRCQREIRLSRLAFKLYNIEFRVTKARRRKLQKKIAPYVDHVVWVWKMWPDPPP